MTGTLSMKLYSRIIRGACPACDARESLAAIARGGEFVNMRCDRCGNKYNVLRGLGAEHIGTDPVKMA